MLDIFRLHSLLLLEAMGAFSNIKGLSMYQDNNEDPYITLKDVSMWPEANDTGADVSVSGRR